jgi:hypothetical protein
MHVAAHEGFKALTVSKLQIEHAAVSPDEGERVELALVAEVVERAEVPPIDFKTLAGAGSMRTKARLGLDCGRTLWR